MKSILVYADGGKAFESRLQVALDLARAQNGHITFLQATPLSGFIVMDPMGGSYVPAAMREQLRADEEKLRASIAEYKQSDDHTANTRKDIILNHAIALHAIEELI